jgi:hypothetical protein
MMLWSQSWRRLNTKLRRRNILEKRFVTVERLDYLSLCRNKNKCHSHAELIVLMHSLACERQ